MKKRIALCVVTAFVAVFGSAACGGADEQQVQQAQQEPKQEAAQPSPPAQSSGLTASGLVGTWEMTHINGGPVDPGIGTQTFSEDGTLQATSLDALTVTGRYDILGDSRIQFTLEGETLPPMEYSLDGDTLMYYVEDPEFPIQQTWRRTS